MIIHVVQPDDTIYSIAVQYGVSVTRLIQDNELVNYSNLVPGQTIVILTPEQTYTVQQGDSLKSIASAFGVTAEQLLRNNPYLADREYIYDGETIVISYSLQGNIFTNGYLLPFVSLEILKKTLPFLTYLSIFNYRASKEGSIYTYYDDDKIIQMANAYGVAPLMLLTTITTRGEANILTAYDLLLNTDYQNIMIENILSILKDKGFYGLNLSFQYISVSNIQLYDNLLRNITTRLKSEGYPVFVNIAPNITAGDDEVAFERVDYTTIGNLADVVTIMQYTWSSTIGPPEPVYSNLYLEEFIKYVITMIPPEKIDVGQSVIGYDWQLPFMPGSSKASSLTYDSAIILARDYGATIMFDEASKTPFFEYEDKTTGIPLQHIVWFVDARSIDSLVNMIPKYGLRGIGVWNVMQYFPQLWLIVNSQYEIETVVD